MVISRDTMRNSNEQFVLQEVFNNWPISRIQVSKQLSLNKVTVYDIFRKLLEEKYIIEIGQGFSTNSGGRKPIMVENEANLTAIFERDFSTSKM